MNQQQRKLALAQITKQAQVAKMAQETAQETTAVDADAYAEEYTKKLFMKLWDSVDIHLAGDE